MRVGTRVMLRRYFLVVISNRVICNRAARKPSRGFPIQINHAMGRVLEILHCNIKCYKSKMGRILGDQGLQPIGIGYTKKNNS